MQKKKFEVKEGLDRFSGRMRRDIYIDGELFPYEIDPYAMFKVNSGDPDAAIELYKHFITSLSEFVGREVTAVDVMVATKTGFI